MLAKELDLSQDLMAAIRPDTELRPVQEKAVKSGLLQGHSMLVCSPTASGKTLIAELACFENIYRGIGKAVYIVPLKALAREKHAEFTKKHPKIRTGLAVGDLDESPSLKDTDMLVTTSEKLDSMIRHHIPWLKDVKVVVVDEIHLLNDHGRGPTLEILITILRELLKNIQIIGLSATIGNPEELAAWLKAELIMDTWRPVKLMQGTFVSGKIDFVDNA
jgi:helicase